MSLSKTPEIQLGREASLNASRPTLLLVGEPAKRKSLRQAQRNSNKITNASSAQHETPLSISLSEAKVGALSNKPKQSANKKATYPHTSKRKVTSTVAVNPRKLVGAQK